MPTAENLTSESRFMALFVGPKHSGKTVAACSWLTDKRIKVSDFDGRIKGILGAPWIRKDKIDYDYIPPRSSSDKIFFQRVNTDLEALLTLVNTGRCPYETYIGDSITSFCKNLMLDSIPLTHAEGKGKKIGVLEMPGPADYGFESVGVDSYMSFLRSLPLNIIVTAHVIDRYDKPTITDERGRTYKDPYAESVVIGEKLSLRDKLSATVPNYFDHIFRFDRKLVRGEEHFFVEYINDIACTSFPNLKPGQHDITGKDFRNYTLNLVNAPNLVEMVK
jgi:hypothetical protein